MNVARWTHESLFEVSHVSYVISKLMYAHGNKTNDVSTQQMSTNHKDGTVTEMESYDRQPGPEDPLGPPQQRIEKLCDVGPHGMLM